MPKLIIEALLYCIAWVALAMFGWFVGGWVAGLALSVGLFPLIALSSAVVLSRTGNFALERGIRWGLLIVCAIGLLSYYDTTF